MDVSNKGSGLAMIRNAFFSADGQRIHHWPELVKRALGEEHNFTYSSFGRSVVASGEHVEILNFPCDQPSKPKPAKDLHSPAPPKPEHACQRLKSFLSNTPSSISYSPPLYHLSILTSQPNL